MKCRICGNEKENQTYEAREMMFGYKDVFRYFQCSKCKCLQIGEFPSNMYKYYPDTYGHHQMTFRRNTIKKFLIGLRDKYALFGKGFIGKLLYYIFPIADWCNLRLIPEKKDTKILA